MQLYKNENFKLIVFFAILTIILTWPVAWQFFSSVPSSGSDTMQVIGVTGEKANLLREEGLFRGTFELAKRSELNITALYAYFQMIFGRVVGYNLLFFETFILSGLGMYLLAFYFTKNKPASLLAGIIFAFNPFHIHNALSTNVGTMHQEWLPFFALYLFRFFENLKAKYFFLVGFFLLLIGFTEHQLLAFTVIFILFFLVYKLITQPKVFLQPKLWIYVIVSVAILSILFFFMFQSLFRIAGSENNYLDPGFKASVKYSNDSLAIFVPPNFHAFWSDSFQDWREKFQRQSDSEYSVYLGYSVLILSLVGIFGFWYLKRKNMPVKGIFFWFSVAVGFYIFSLGPYLHYKGVLDPPIKMPYFLIYQYLPFYKNIRTVGRFFVWSMVGFSMLAAWGSAFINFQFSIFNFQKSNKSEICEKGENEGWNIITKSKFVYIITGLIIIIEFLAIPLKTNSLIHSSFYEKIGEDKEKYSVIEVPGSTSYDFASRDLVWRSIHRKNTINGYDFARVNQDAYTFQRGTPIIRTLLYDIPGGSDNNDRDIMKDSYYDISAEILNYYGIRYVILDKEGLKGHPDEGDPNLLYPAKAYIKNVIKCVEEHEDEYLYACKIDREVVPQNMFLSMDFSNKHWVGKSESKNGIQRWAENGAGIKLVNMSKETKNAKLSFNLKIDKPLRLMIIFNGFTIFDKYITEISQKHEIKANLEGIKPGENPIIFGVYSADNQEIKSEKKSDTARIYQVKVE